MNWLKQQQVQPNKVAILLYKQNLSLAIVDGNGKITNRLIILDEGTELGQITELALSEVDNVLR